MPPELPLGAVAPPCVAVVLLPLNAFPPVVELPCPPPTAMHTLSVQTNPLLHASVAAQAQRSVPGVHAGFVALLLQPLINAPPSNPRQATHRTTG